MTNLEKGIQFEKKIKALLSQAGLIVTQTRKSNDFGVDLLVEYDGYVIALQCKYRDDGYVVGGKAVQEVVAGRAYYGADKCVVITNQIFSAHAVVLAECNDVLLIDGSMVGDLSADEDGNIGLFDTVFGSEYRASMSRASMAPLEESGCVKIADLMERYDVSRRIIVEYLIPAGLPLVKRNGVYVTTWIELWLWEEETGSVTYGREKKVLELCGAERFR